MILCKDCKRCDLGKNSTPPPQWPHGRALHYWCQLDAVEIDPVSGNQLKPELQHCHELRASGGACGVDGKLFVPADALSTPGSLPLKTGYYWYQHPGENPEIVYYEVRVHGEYSLSYVWRLAPKPTLGGAFYPEISGDFLGNKLEVPSP